LLQYGTTSSEGNFRATASPRDTAGLKWPPEMCPNAVIASARPRPNANAIPTFAYRPAADVDQNGDRVEAEKEEEERAERLRPEAQTEPRGVHLTHLL
jgi:hypothetical protein